MIANEVLPDLKMTLSHYQQCSRCVMDTSDPEIVFDADGQCNHCSYYLGNVGSGDKTSTASEVALQRIIDKMKKIGKGRSFDCVLGLSGGVDSCYTAWLLKDLGLRVLAVHMDNGWDADTSVRNINSVVDRLGIDYQSYVLDWEEFKDLQRAFLRASVPEIETPTDMAIAGSLHKVAAHYKIRFVVSGSNIQTEGILPRSWHYDIKDLVYMKAIHKRFGSGHLKNFPLYGYLQELNYKYNHHIRNIYILNYIDYKKENAVGVLKDVLNWKEHGGKHYESIYTRFIHSYVLPVKFNIDYRRATLSTQICSGEVCREYALEKLKEPTYDPYRIADEKIYIAKKLGISLGEMETILHAPVKSYRDYPNNKKKLELMYRIYRKLNKRKN